LEFGVGSFPFRRWRSTEPLRQVADFLEPQVYGSGVLAVPRPGSTRRRSRCVKKKMKVISGYSASSATSSAVGSSDSAFGDFPLALGLALIQGVLRSSGSGAPPSASVRRRRRNLEEGLRCIFVLFLGLSVRTEY
jgi:hypothetical protein